MTPTCKITSHTHSSYIDIHMYSPIQPMPTLEFNYKLILLTKTLKQQSFEFKTTTTSHLKQ